MKILQVFGIMNMGGAESRMMDVYRNIDREKYHFDFLTHSNEKQYFEDEIKSLGGTFYKINFPSPLNMIKYINQIRKIIREGKYDVIHAHTSYHSGIIMLASRLENIKIRIAHARTTSFKHKCIKTKILYIIGKILIKCFATHKIAISQETGKFLFDKDYTIIPNSIDLYKYENIDCKEINKLRNEFNIKETDFIVGQIGRFESVKNHIWTINWFKDFLKIKPNAKLIFVGDGELRGEIENKCKELGIYDNVIFTGVREDVPALLHLFNVLILPSLFEGFPGVTLEAQASCVLCVISDSITKETDMGLNMIKRVSLNDNFRIWHDSILDSQNIKIHSKEEIKNAFERNNFTLNSTIKIYCEIYNGAK